MGYRGGDAGISGYGAESIKATAEGRTEGQRARDFRNRAMLAAVQGALTMGRIAGGAAGSRELQDKQADDRLRSSAEKYKSPEYTGRTGDTPAWLGEHGEGNVNALKPSETGYGEIAHNDPYSPIGPDLKLPTAEDHAKSSLALQSDNQSKLEAPVNGLYTQSGMDRMNEDKGMEARDVATGTGLMRTRAVGIHEGFGPR